VARRDATSPQEALSTAARAFLRDPARLGPWCEVAGLETPGVMALVQAVLPPDP
jgi:hypothetical protein